MKIHFESIDSTNAYAKREYLSFPSDRITYITAEEQTAGRGRYLRKWLSPKGINLYATFCFRLRPNALQWQSLTQVMAFSFASLLMEEDLNPRIKWPNDVQLNQKKVSGVLCETIFHEDWIQILLGIGINVNMELSDLETIDQPATSLKNETGRLWDKDKLFSKLQKRFSFDLALLQKEGFSPFHLPLENLLAHKGEQVRCFDGKKEWVGIGHSLTSDGQLNLLLPDGRLHTVLSGDLGPLT